MPRKPLASSMAALVLAACSGRGEQNEVAQERTAAPAASPDFASLKGDPAKGEALFFQCRACHSVDEGQNGIGPSLHGIVGKPAASASGYSYSSAIKNSGITWTGDKLYAFLESPQRAVPGTRMAFGGIPDPQKRADLIAWLATK